MPGPHRPTAVLLMAMGGPDTLENVEPYLQEVRGGRPTSPELVHEIRERYRLTGGKSPVLDITREVARRLEQQLNGLGDEWYCVSVGLRHWRPFIKEAYAELMDESPERLIAICMAPQYSTMSIGAYIKKVEEARAACGGDCPITFVKSWHRHPSLIAAIAQNVQRGLDLFPPDQRETIPVVFTAHSLPERIREMGDPYPDEVRGTMEAVCELIHPPTARLAFQSQGRTNEPWIGPSIESVVDELAMAGHRNVLVAPIGFLCDHVEVSYDLDIELRQRALNLGLRLERIPMLNASPALVDTLASLVREHETVVVPS
ncbi:ferrochelatase [Nitrospira sp.]|nr:ferrochelatase [Nitrospira sp.]